MSITISFECSVPMAYLLTAVYDLLSEPVLQRDYAATTVENFDWLIDELAGVTPEVNHQKIMLCDNGGLELAAKALLDYEEARNKEVNKRLEKELKNLTPESE